MTTTPTPLLDGIIQEASIHGNACYPKITEMARELRLLKSELTASRELCRQYKELAAEFKIIADNYFAGGTWYPFVDHEERWFENAKRNDEALAKLEALNAQKI